MVYNRPLFKLNLSNDPSKLEILAENLLDALVDGCIAGMLTGWLANPDIGWKIAFATGFVKFLIRLKELRGKKE